MEKPTVIEVYADNGELSHYALIDTKTGEKIWSENPEECSAMGYPVKSVNVVGSTVVNFIPENKMCDCSRKYDYTAGVLCDGNCK